MTYTEALTLVIAASEFVALSAFLGIMVNGWLVRRYWERKVKATRIWRRMNYGPGWGWLPE